MNVGEIVDRTNMICGAIVAVLSYIFGSHWVLFVGFLGLNIADYITGRMKAYKNKKINSEKGAAGIVKKLGYWIMICLAFGISVIFMEIGNVIGVDLGVSTLIGWFVLASLIINEVRSIIENFVECGYKVPKILIEGLEVASKVIDAEENDKEEPKKDET